MSVLLMPVASLLIFACNLHLVLKCFIGLRYTPLNLSTVCAICVHVARVYSDMKAFPVRLWTLSIRQGRLMNKTLCAPQECFLIM